MPKYRGIKGVFHNNYLFLADFSNSTVKTGIKRMYVWQILIFNSSSLRYGMISVP